MNSRIRTSVYCITRSFVRAEEKEERLRSFLTGRGRKQTRVKHFDRWSIFFFFFPALLSTVHILSRFAPLFFFSRDGTRSSAFDLVYWLFFLLVFSKKINAMNETTIEENKVELQPPPIINLVEDSIASRTKEITKRPKRERSPSKDEFLTNFFIVFFFAFSSSDSKSSTSTENQESQRGRTEITG